MDAVWHLILLDVVHVLLLEHVIGDMNVLADLVYVNDGVARHTPFRHLVFRLVLFVAGADFSIIQGYLGFQVFRLDQRIVQLHLLILVAKLIL